MCSYALDETDLSGSITNGTFSEYVFFNGKRIARRNSSNTVFYNFADHLGTSRVIGKFLSTTTSMAVTTFRIFTKHSAASLITNSTR